MSTTMLLPENAVTLYRGTSKILRLEVGSIDSEPVNLTGATVYFTVKRHLADQIPLIQKTSTNILEIEITLPRVGQAKIFLRPSDTLYLDAGNYIFDVLVVMPSGDRYVVIPPSTLVVEGTVTYVPV